MKRISHREIVPAMRACVFAVSVFVLVIYPAVSMADIPPGDPFGGHPRPPRPPSPSTPDSPLGPTSPDIPSPWTPPAPPHPEPESPWIGYEPEPRPTSDGCRTTGPLTIVGVLILLGAARLRYARRRAVQESLPPQRQETNRPPLESGSACRHGQGRLQASGVRVRASRPGTEADQDRPLP